MSDSLRDIMTDQEAEDRAISGMADAMIDVLEKVVASGRLYQSAYITAIKDTDVGVIDLRVPFDQMPESERKVVEACGSLMLAKFAYDNADSLAKASLFEKLGAELERVSAVNAELEQVVRQLTIEANDLKFHNALSEKFVAAYRKLAQDIIEETDKTVAAVDNPMYQDRRTDPWRQRLQELDESWKDPADVELEPGPTVPDQPGS